VGREEAAPLSDVALTGYHAVKRSLHLLGPGATAVVIGAGGLGQMASIGSNRSRHLLRMPERAVWPLCSRPLPPRVRGRTQTPDYLQRLARVHRHSVCSEQSTPPERNGRWSHETHPLQNVLPHRPLHVVVRV
jgi:hypothetical protein